jgi:asparagine synthase (glutamine-hydrolysing)
VSAIAGIWRFDDKPGASADCARMLDAQEIYGPDDGRQWADGAIAMGRRLFRLLPEDAHDRQPLEGADGQFVLVADVRLDNRAELTAALGWPAGCAAELCDAAILLACLERWQEAALDRLVGDFAFVLWDSRRQRLLLARDFLGQRPLYYHRGKGFFAFASMAKGLHALADIPYAPDEQVMAEFITLMPQWGPRSFFAGIDRVEPGHFVIVTRDGVSVTRYWNPAGPSGTRGKASDYADGVRHHLEEATRACLRGARGSVAAQLSGGMDSSAVTATAARLLAAEGGRVTAFTAVPGDNYDKSQLGNILGDEGQLAGLTAQMYPNIEHVLIRSGHLSPLAELDKQYFLFERPILNLCNSVWLHAIARAAQERNLKILLGGVMGNMSLSYDGEEILPELLRAWRLVRLVQVAREQVAVRQKRYRSMAMAAIGPFLPPWIWRSLFRATGRRMFDVLEYSVVRPDYLSERNLHAIAKERDHDFNYQPFRNGYDLRVWCLRRVDPGNYNKGFLGGWGIDTRDPTADKRLVEFCLRIPIEAYFADGEPRALARNALADRVPREVLNERRLGYQGADWHEGLTASRGEVLEELEQLTRCAPAGRSLDLERMQGLVRNWPQSRWHSWEVKQAYRFALLRGISAGHFLRKASRSN